MSSCTAAHCDCTSYRASGSFRQTGVGAGSELCECGHIDRSHGVKGKRRKVKSHDSSARQRTFDPTNIRQTTLGWIVAERRKGGAGASRTLRVLDDTVECTHPGSIRKGSTQTIRYDSVAQVVLTEGFFWSEIAVETRGGAGIVLGGLNKREATEAKNLIDQRVALARRSS